MNYRRQTDRATLCAEFWALGSDEALVDRPTAGAVAGLGAKSMELLASRGGGPAYRVIGRKAMYRKADVVAWLRKAERQTTTAERSVRCSAERTGAIKPASAERSGVFSHVRTPCKSWQHAIEVLAAAHAEVSEKHPNTLLKIEILQSTDGKNFGVVWTFKEAVEKRRAA